jgi:hypothetical protein
VGRADVVARRRLVSRAACAILVVGAHAARDPDAGAPPSDRAGACPEQEAVLAALRKLGARDDPNRVLNLAVEAGLEITDLGSTFRVTVGGRMRDYDDIGRDCERRARLAAVFATLVLAPDSQVSGGRPSAGLPDGAAAGTPEEAASAPVPSSPPAPKLAPDTTVASAPAAPDAWPELAAGAELALAPHRGSALTIAGFAVGVARRSATWSIGMTLVIPVLPADFSIGSTSVQLARYPLRLVVARTLALGALRATAEAGGVLSMLRVERTAPPPETMTTRFEPGAHLGLELAFPARRVSFFCGVASDWIPQTYALTLDPEGEVDRTPGVWFSSEAGLRLALH